MNRADAYSSAPVVMTDEDFYRYFLQFMMNDKTDYNIKFTNADVTGKDLINEALRRLTLVQESASA